MIYRKEIGVIINKEGRQGIIFRTATQDVIPYPEGVIKRKRSINL